MVDCSIFPQILCFYATICVLSANETSIHFSRNHCHWRHQGGMKPHDTIVHTVIEIWRALSYGHHVDKSLEGTSAADSLWSVVSVAVLAWLGAWPSLYLCTVQGDRYTKYHLSDRGDRTLSPTHSQQLGENKARHFATQCLNYIVYFVYTVASRLSGVGGKLISPGN
jgi:hypothetical protein